MEDEKIIELFFARSEQAIIELDAKYGKKCRSLAQNILEDRRDAEECVSDAYLGVWNAVPPERPYPLLTFVLKIVRNVSLTRCQKNAAAKRNRGAEAAICETAGLLSAADTVEKAVEANELIGIVERFLDTLNAENRVIFVRRYWFFDSYADIAKTVGITEKNVSVRLTRIRKQLQNYLKEEGYYEEQ